MIFDRLRKPGKGKAVSDYNRDEGPMETEPWCDLHSHFLPGIDDGCRTVEESVKLLRYAGDHGIAGMVATPHYYPEQPIESFIEKRNAASESLKKALKDLEEVNGQEIKVPVWCLGAEVAYYEGISSAAGIERLTMGDSGYLLLELPFNGWNNSILRDIYTLINILNITPILAHLERYIDIADERILEQLYDLDLLIQMNGGYIINRTRDAKRRIRDGHVNVLGSDTHNMTSRIPNLDQAVYILSTSGMDGEKEQLRSNNLEIFRRAAGIN